VASRDGSRAPRQDKMGQKDHGLNLYSPKASPRKEREDLRGGFGFGDFGKRRRRRLREGGMPDRWVHGVSDTIEEGNVAARFARY
jgi:hypothetical protein